MSKLLDRPIVIGSPVEIEQAVEAIRQELSILQWIERPYFIAQKFMRKKNNRTFFFPETYAPSAPGQYDYNRLTPRKDISGQFFFIVGDGTQDDFKANQYNYLTYPVSIIFSVNLELINKIKLNQGLFTQELVRDARRILTNTMINHEFYYEIIKETRDLQECFREFVLDEIEAYNRAPMQCFRFDLNVHVQEVC